MTSWPARVAGTARLGPSMVRVTVCAPGLRTYEAAGQPDESCAISIPGVVTQRFYSIRRLDRTRGEIDLDFVAHGRGPAARWAASARTGDAVVLGPARGTYDSSDRQRVIIGDLSALPAIGRIVETAAPRDRLTVVVIIADRADEQPLACRADLDLTWVVAGRAEDGPAALVGAVHDLGEPAEDVTMWVAGEASATRRIRTRLRDELGRSRRSDQVLGYWRLDQAGWAARYAAARPDVERRIAAARRTAPDEDTFLDAIERIYTEAGL